MPTIDQYPGMTGQHTETNHAPDHHPRGRHGGGNLL